MDTFQISGRWQAYNGAQDVFYMYYSTNLHAPAMGTIVSALGQKMAGYAFTRHSV